MSETDKMPYFKMEWDDRNRYEKEMEDDPTAAADAFVNNEKTKKEFDRMSISLKKSAGIKELKKDY